MHAVKITIISCVCACLLFFKWDAMIAKWLESMRGDGTKNYIKKISIFLLLLVILFVCFSYHWKWQITIGNGISVLSLVCVLFFQLYFMVSLRVRIIRNFFFLYTCWLLSKFLNIIFSKWKKKIKVNIENSILQNSIRISAFGVLFFFYFILCLVFWLKLLLIANAILC